MGPSAIRPIRPIMSIAVLFIQDTEGEIRWMYAPRQFPPPSLAPPAPPLLGVENDRCFPFNPLDMTIRSDLSTEKQQ